MGGSGWKGVDVAVASTGLNKKSGFKLTARGAFPGEFGKLHARIDKRIISRTKDSFLVFIMN